MAQTLSDNLLCRAPKQLDDRCGVFASGAWRPFNDINEFNARFVLAARYVNQTFWMKSTTDPTKASLWALDTAKNPYNVLSTVDLSNYYTKSETNNLLTLKANITYVDDLFDELSADLVEEIEERIEGDLNLVQKPPKLIGVDGFYYPDGYLSLDGTKILNNYDRFNGTPFNVSKVTTWFDGTTMNDSKVDNIIYFKNPITLGGGYSKRDYDGGVDAKWFGAKGDGIADDTSALNAFANYIMNRKCGSAIMIGTFKVTGKISFIAGANPITGLYADCTITSNYTAEDEMVLFENWYNGNISGHFQVIGRGSTTWANRTNGIGIYIKNCSKIHFSKISVSFTKYDGVLAENLSYLFNVEQLTTSYCGSSTISGGAVFKSVQILSKINSGGDNSTEQRSILTLDELPIGVQILNTFVKIGTRIHQVYAIDTPNKTISVYPWTDSTLSLPQTAYLYMGAGLRIIGADASCAKIGQHDAISCGIGLLNQALYPATIDVFVAQFNGIGHVLSRDNGAASDGGAMLYSYWETNDFDFVIPSTSYPNMNYALVSTVDLSLSKCIRLSPSIGNNISEQYNNFIGISIGINGKSYELTNNQSPNVGYSSISIRTSTNNDYNIRANSYTLGLLDNTKELTRLFGYRTFKIFATGTGLNGEPTGTYTFVPEVGYSINGGAVGANYLVTNMSGRVMFYGRLNGVDWDISMVNLTNNANSNEVIDATTTPYTKATINTAYPNAKKYFTVRQDGANQTYVKKDNSPTGNWSTFPTVQLT